MLPCHSTTVRVLVLEALAWPATLHHFLVRSNVQPLVHQPKGRLLEAGQHAGHLAAVF